MAAGAARDATGRTSEIQTSEIPVSEIPASEIRAAGAALWRAILDPDRAADGAADRAEDRAGDRADNGTAAAAAGLARLLTPALAGYFLAAAEAPAGRPLLDPEDVRQSLLMNRLTGSVQRHWMAAIADTGIPVVALKGFAFAHTVYPDPDLRTIGDLDLLVRADDSDRLFAFLRDSGFVFEELPSSAWGFISDASFQPMVSADGMCSIDVHVQPDCYPAYRSLTAERLFAGARTVQVGDMPVRVPSPAHALALCVTNAAKDKFGPFSVRKLVDVAVLLRAVDGAVDWDEVAALARDGHFAGPARAAFALLIRLGMQADGIPPALRAPPGGPRAPLFRALLRDYESMFAAEPGPWRVLAREIGLCTEPDVAVHNAFLRLRGLVAPRRGVPEGYAGRS